MVYLKSMKIAPLINEEDRKRFHKIVQLLLHFCCRGRKYILPTMSFLTQRVDCTMVQDYSKLRRLMNYVHDTLDLISIVGIEDVGKLHRCIDAAHGAHHNMRIHTGGACTFGVGMFCAMSSKQKLNTASSTESELVGNSNFVTKPIALTLFMEA